MIWDIDLIFGMRVYNHKLQINFEIRFGWMIFGQFTAVWFWNLAKYLVVATLFHYDLRYWLDFWYECIIIVTDQLWNSFRLNDFWPTYSRWALKFGKIFSCHHFFSLWFVILSLLLRKLKKGETFASLLNIHGGDIRFVLTHLVFLFFIFFKYLYMSFLTLTCYQL
jgi:hypothetical protein